MDNIKELLNNPDIWGNGVIRELSSYRKAIYTKVYFDRHHTTTSKGEVVIIKQLRKDFYKPRNWSSSKEGFFSLDEIMSRERVRDSISDKDCLNLYNNLLSLLETGHVLSTWDIKEIKSYAYLSKDNWLYFKEKLNNDPMMTLPGNIQVMKYDKPQFDGHKALSTDNAGDFYYVTRYCPSEFKKDYDYRHSDQDLQYEHTENEGIIEEEDYNVLSPEVEIQNSHA